MWAHTRAYLMLAHTSTAYGSSVGWLPQHGIRRSKQQHARGLPGTTPTSLPPPPLPAPPSNLLHCPVKTIEALHIIFRKTYNLLSLPVSTFSFTSTRCHFATSGRANTQSNKSKATAQSKVWRKTRWLEYWLCDWCHNSLIGWGLES